MSADLKVLQMHPGCRGDEVAQNAVGKHLSEEAIE
jgi:hypothetical protein